MNPEEIKALVTWAKSQGKSDEEIAQVLKEHGVDWSPPSPIKKAIHGGSASFLQGVSLNLAGRLSPDLKKASDEFRQEHSIAGPISNIAGALTGAAALPVSLGAGFVGRGLVGAGAAGVSSAAEGKSARDVATDAAIGGAAGIAVPAVVGTASKIAGRFFNPRFRPVATNAKATGPLLPDDAEALMARQESLAPGASTAAGLDPGLPASTRVIGADAALARKAKNEAVKRLKIVKSSMDAFKPKYDAILKGKSAPTSNGKIDITKIVTDNGLMPMNGQIQMTVVQRLRHDLANKFETAKGMKRGEIGEAWAKLNDWLQFHSSSIKAIDSDYGVLKRMEKAEKEIIKNLNEARKQYAASRAAGIEPGSPGAKLPGNNGLAQELFHPSREALGKAAYGNLLTPGQISPGLLNARNKAMGMQRFSPGLLAAFGMGDQIPDFTGGLLGN